MPGWLMHHGTLVGLLLTSFFLATVSYVRAASLRTSVLSGIPDLADGARSTSTLCRRATYEVSTRFPETMWSYDEGYLLNFTSRIGPKGLAIYVGQILWRWDPLFAIGTTLSSISLNVMIARAWPDDQSTLALATFASVAIVAYGIADVAEDFALARALDCGQGKRMLANAFTRLKLVMIVLSGTGLVIFLVLAGSQRMRSRFTQCRPRTGQRRASVQGQERISHRPQPAEPCSDRCRHWVGTDS